MVPVAPAADPSPDPAPDPRPKAAPAPARRAPAPAPKPVYTPPSEPTYTPPARTAPAIRAAPARPKAKPKPKPERTKAKPHRAAPKVVVAAPSVGPAVSGPDLLPLVAAADAYVSEPAGGMGIFWSLALALGGLLIAAALVPDRSRFRPVVALGHVRIQLFAIGCSLLGGALLPVLLR